MRDWDQGLDEVLGAYNSTRHAIVVLKIDTAYLIPEFARRSFATHDAYVDHEIHDLVRRNTHKGSAASEAEI